MVDCLKPLYFNMVGHQDFIIMAGRGKGRSQVDNGPKQHIKDKGILQI